MKCPSCGAETKSAKFCEYCGSEMPKENPNINITNNYYGTTDNSRESSDAGRCPKCNSTRVEFQREQIASIDSSQYTKSGLSNISNSVTQTTYRTIGLCQNCGYTWDPNEKVYSSSNSRQNEAPAKKGKGILWWFLILCVWPIALCVWFYKTDKVKLEKKWKAIIIAAFWLFSVLISALSSGQTSTEAPSAVESSETVELLEDMYFI